MRAAFKKYPTLIYLSGFAAKTSPFSEKTEIYFFFYLKICPFIVYCLRNSFNILEKRIWNGLNGFNENRFKLVNRPGKKRNLKDIGYQRDSLRDFRFASLHPK